MKLSKREFIMLVLLLIVAIIFIEFRFVINPMINKYDELRSERGVVQDEVQNIELDIAIAKQNESKRDENLEQIKQISKRYFGELQKDALLVRTHDIILEQGLLPTQYSLQQIQTAPLVPETYSAVKLSYEMKDLAETYRLLIEQNDEVNIPDDEQTGEEAVAAGPVELYQINFTVRGTYDQLNNYLDALSELKRSLMVASLSLVPDASQPTDVNDPDIVETDEERESFLSMQVTLYYFGLSKLIPEEDQFNQWYREPFVPIAFNPFKPLPVPVEVNPTDVTETEETLETEETTSESEEENTDE
jgi:Tfp pilus assembly protein PilO